MGGAGDNAYAKVRKSSERPCYKLTADLLKTYKGINELYYEQKKKKQMAQEAKNSSKAVDDEQGNYIVNVGDEIGGRYLVQEALGKGSFGVVVKALDQKRDESVAVKVIKNKAQFFQQAKVEIDILTKLNTQAGEDHNIVKLRKVFTWKEHLCLVFELLSFNLYDLLKYTRFNGISLTLVRKFAYQILKTLDFLSSAPIGIIHCDLKPENILLKNPKRSGIKVIDFGSSCQLTKKMYKYIQSRFYRSPEVILGLPYDCAIDMWSLGCVLVEMHTGQPVFDGRDEAEQLMKMEAILGPHPQRMAESSPKRKKFFQWDHKLKRWVLDPPERKTGPFPSKTLEDILGVSIGGPGGRRKGQAGHSETDYLQFADFVKQMFSYLPGLRITPAVALQHPFLAPVVTELSSTGQLPSSVPHPPSSPCASVSRTVSEVPAALAASYPSAVSVSDLKWQSPTSARDSLAADVAKQAPPERRISLPPVTTAVQRQLDFDAVPVDHVQHQSANTPSTAVSAIIPHPPPSTSYLSRTQSAPYTAPNPASTVRRADCSPAYPSEPCLHDAPNHIRARDYQSARFGSPISPSANFANGSLRLKPKQPGGTQAESLATMQSPPSVLSTSAGRNLYLSPATRAVLYVDSPNSGKYGPGTPSTPRTGGGAELRQYIAGVPFGSPLPQADGRKWLPSPMADISRKLCSESPCAAEVRVDPEKTESRTLGLASWKPASYSEMAYSAGSRLSTALHHGGAEPMLR